MKTIFFFVSVCDVSVHNIVDYVVVVIVIFMLDYSEPVKWLFYFLRPAVFCICNYDGLTILRASFYRLDMYQKITFK